VILRRVIILAAFIAGSDLHAQDFLDRLDQHLTLSAFDDQFRTRLSGTLDLEFYTFDLPAPGLIDSLSENIFNPRLTLFVDSQIGPAVYFFSQVRFDRHFDPTDQGAQARLDEYALRFTPWADGRLSVQIGKFATVIGRWVQRHLSWDNPFLNAPLIYENITAIESRLAPAFTADLDADLQDAKYEYNPVIWGPSYTSGALVAGQVGKFDYAVEFKNAPLASRPERWDATRMNFSHPSVGGRVGFRPNESWNYGISGSIGPYFEEEAASSLPPGQGIGDFDEILLAQDITFELHHWQIWAEFHEARFEVPLVGNADVFGYFLEAKYKFTPQFFGAVRWNQQLYGDVPDGFGGEHPWGHDAWRLDLAVAYRFTEHLQLKVQYDLEHDDNARHGFGHLLGMQWTARF
jgi:hypothetical protein